MCVFFLLLFFGEGGLCFVTHLQNNTTVCTIFPIVDETGRNCNRHCSRIAHKHNGAANDANAYVRELCPNLRCSILHDHTHTRKKKERRRSRKSSYFSQFTTCTRFRCWRQSVWMYIRCPVARPRHLRPGSCGLTRYLLLLLPNCATCALGAEKIWLLFLGVVDKQLARCNFFVVALVR